MDDIGAASKRSALRPLAEDGASKVIIAYLLAEVEEYRQLSELRKQGWNNPEGDKLSAQQSGAPKHTPSAVLHAARSLFYNMLKIGRDLHISTGVFTIAEPGLKRPKILDLCMAPGGFLSAALEVNPSATATAYSLPVEDGGHENRVDRRRNIKTKLLDITMLAKDLGAHDIPAEHPDVANFLPKQFHVGRVSDIVLCDGQVHFSQARKDYRAKGEPHRLSTAQLAIGLEHLKTGGTLLLRLNRVEAPESIDTLHKFHQFSTIQLFKSTRQHDRRSVFWMIATNVQVEHPIAIEAVEEWKRKWKIATFGSDGEFVQYVRKDKAWAEAILGDFGPALVSMGKPIWEIQAQALAKAPYITGVQAHPQKRGQEHQQAD